MAVRNFKTGKKIMLSLYLSVAFGVAIGFVFGGRGYRDVTIITEDYSQIDKQALAAGFNMELALITSFVLLVAAIVGILVYKKVTD